MQGGHPRPLSDGLTCGLETSRPGSMDRDFQVAWPGRIRGFVCLTGAIRGVRRADAHGNTAGGASWGRVRRTDAAKRMARADQARFETDVSGARIIAAPNIRLGWFGSGSVSWCRRRSCCLPQVLRGDGVFAIVSEAAKVLPARFSACQGRVPAGHHLSCNVLKDYLDLKTPPWETPFLSLAIQCVWPALFGFTGSGSRLHLYR